MHPTMGARRVLTYAATLVMLAPGSAYAQQPVQTAGDREPIDVRVAGLRADIDRAIATANSRSVDWGVLVVSADRGDTLYARSSFDPLTPASNAKILTTAAALHYLGPDFRFTTFLVTSGTVTDGVLVGDLVVYGTGDPSISSRFGLRTAVWESFADSLFSRGIHEIRGDVVGDASYFQGPGTGEGWRRDYVDAAYAAPAGALSYSENIASVRITPGPDVGAAPIVEVLPGGGGIAVDNEAGTVAGRRASIRVRRQDYGALLSVTGQIGRGAAPVYRSLPVTDPAAFAAGALRSALEERGIVVGGSVRSSVQATESLVTGSRDFAPAFAAGTSLRVLAVHQSPRLIEIIDVVNKKSQNFIAEQLIRVVGRVISGHGSAQGGSLAVDRFLFEDVGIEPAAMSLRLVDGSGLSSLNRISASLLVDVLAYMLDSQHGAEYWSTLPEAGRRDGLARMASTPAANNLRAKTGTISRVSALSGYVQAANEERLVFSILSNDIASTWRAKRIEDLIGARLAAFDRPLPAEPVSTNVEPSAEAETMSNEADERISVATAAAVGAGEASTSDTAASTAPPTAEPRSTYLVRRGDTLSEIALLHGTTVAALLAANPGVDARRLMPGDELRIR